MHEIDPTPFLVAWVYPFCALLLAGVAVRLMLESKTWLAAHAKFLDAQTRQKLIDIENTALQVGVDYVMKIIQAAGGKLHPKTDSWLLEKGADIAISHAAGTLNKQGDDPETVANKILAKLPDVVVDGGPAAPLGNIDVKPLPPLK